MVNIMSIKKRIRRLYRFVYSLCPPYFTTIEINSSKTNRSYSADFRTATPIERERLTGRLMETNRPIMKRILSDIQLNDDIWDIGAHLGRYTCFFAAATDGTVLGVEPHPINADRIEYNLELNGLSATIIQAAVGETATEQTFYSRHKEAGEFLSTVISEDEGYHEYKIPIVTGEKLSSEAGGLPSVVRIDTVGAEPPILRTLEDQLTVCRLLYVHTYPQRYNDKYQGVNDHLQSLGFETEQMNESNIIIAKKDV